MTTAQTAKNTKASAKDAAAKAHASKAGTADDHTSTPKAPAKRATKSADVSRTKPKMAEPTNPPGEITEEQRQGDRRASDRERSDAAMKFTMQQLGQEAQKPKVDMEAFNADLKALQEKYGVTANVQVKAPRNTGVKQNGIARPGAETTSGKIWSVADKISFDTKSVAPIAALRDHPDMKGVNEATLKTQYARWRQFHNVSGRLPRIHTLQQEEGHYDAALPNVVGAKS